MNARVHLALHEWYSVVEAVTAFGDKRTRPVSLCDDNFIVLPKAVLCFFTVGDSKTKPYVSSPSCAVWRSVHYTWGTFPKAISQVYDLSKKPIRKIKDHLVFLRSKADGPFFYAGPAHLGSYGGVAGGGLGIEATFSLNEKLPREDWLLFGGYPGWLVEVNHHETQRIDKGDLKTFKKSIKEVPRRST